MWDTWYIICSSTRVKETACLLPQAKAASRGQSSGYSNVLFVVAYRRSSPDCLRPCPCRSDVCPLDTLYTLLPLPCLQSADSGVELASLASRLREANAALEASKGTMEAAVAKHVRLLDSARKVRSGETTISDVPRSGLCRRKSMPVRRSSESTHAMGAGKVLPLLPFGQICREKLDVRSVGGAGY